MGRQAGKLMNVCFHWIPINHDLTLKSSHIEAPAYLVLVCMVIYAGFYSSGMGNNRMAIL
jgi:SP family myo-inositol transporter-like MFS transporter 13